MLLFGARSRGRYLRFRLFGNLYKLELYSVWKNVLLPIPSSKGLDFTANFGSVGRAQLWESPMMWSNVLTQDMAPWLIVYFKVQKFEKQLVQEGPSPEAGHKTLIKTLVCLPHTQEKEHPVSEDKGRRGIWMNWPCWVSLKPIPFVLPHLSSTHRTASNLTWKHSGVTSLSGLHFLMKALVSRKTYLTVFLCFSVNLSSHKPPPPTPQELRRYRKKMFFLPSI